MELEPILCSDRYRWLIRVMHTRQLDLADWRLLSFVDSQGFERSCSVYDVQEIKPGVLAMTRT
jgi:hypothetical protein